jgi:hypothetical protein
MGLKVLGLFDFGKFIVLRPLTRGGRGNGNFLIKAVKIGETFPQ